MKLFKLTILIIVLASGFILFSREAHAAEGVVELRSNKGEKNRCFASYILMPNSSYTVLVSCRDLIYPPQPSLFNYIVWATPTDGGNAVRLGELGVGKASFNTRIAFSGLFVTIEQSKSPRTPEGEVVMQGSGQEVEFLDRPTTPTPTEELAEGEEKEVPLKDLSTRNKILLAFRRAGLVIFLVLATTVALVFVLTRQRH